MLKNLIVSLFAGVLLMAVYVWSFGLPSSLSAYWPAPAEQTAQPTGPSAGSGRPSRPGGGGATTVVVEPLKRLPYIDTLRAIGSTVAQQSVDVVASVSGMVTETSIQANAKVAAGDKLLQLDSRTEVLNLEIAQAELDQALQAVTRYKRLSDSAAVTAVDVAEAEIAARLAKANFGLAQIALDDRTVRAPIAGRLGLSDVEVGDRISSDQIIVTIDNIDMLLIQFELPERSIGLLEIGRSIQANTPVLTGHTFAGKIIAFDSRLDEVTRSVTVRAKIDNADHRLRSGMTFAIRITDQTDPLPTVPATAVTWNREGAGVWVDTDGSVSRKPVTILYREGDQVWIDADIAENASIVTEGAQKLREGGKVQIKGENKPRAEEPA